MNETILNIFTYGIPLLLVFIAGVYVGVYYERIEWNKLIQAGKIPRPGP